MIARAYLIAGSALMGLSIALGAFGAHYVKNNLQQFANAFETGVYYQTIHALALLVLGVLIHQSLLKETKCYLHLFLVSIAIFSGSLYLYTFTGMKTFAYATPVGGVLFMITWLWVTVDLIRQT